MGSAVFGVRPIRQPTVGYASQSTIAVTASDTTTPIIQTAEFTAGSVDVPAGATITSLTIYGSNDGTNFYLLYEMGADMAALAVLASRTTRLPDEAFGRPYIKLVGDAAGSVILNLGY
jgi:hypothetical protein